VQGSSRGLITVLSHHFPGGTDEKHGNLGQDCRRPAKIQVQACSEYKSIALLLHKSVHPRTKLVLATRQK
jgi:hypothetical protein